MSGGIGDNNKEQKGSVYLAQIGKGGGESMAVNGKSVKIVSSLEGVEGAFK